MVYGEKSEILRIAVFDLEAIEGVTKERAASVSEILRTEIGDTGVFEVIERSYLNKVMEEAKLQLSGITSDSEEERLKLGRLLSIKYALVGSISLIEKTIVINIRLFNLETGKVLISKSFYTTKEALVMDIRSIAQSIAEASQMQSPESMLSKVEESIRGKDFEYARQLLIQVEQKHGETERTRALKKQIMHEISLDFYNRASKMYINGSYQMAKDLIYKAFEYEPQNAEYKALSTKIDAALLALNNTKPTLIDSYSNNYTLRKVFGFELGLSRYSEFYTVLGTKFPGLMAFHSAIEYSPMRYWAVYGAFDYIGILGNQSSYLPDGVEKYSILQTDLKFGMRFFLPVLQNSQIYFRLGGIVSLFTEFISDGVNTVNITTPKIGLQFSLGTRYSFVPDWGLYTEMTVEPITAIITSIQSSAAYTLQLGVFFSMF